MSSIGDLLAGALPEGWQDATAPTETSGPDGDETRADVPEGPAGVVLAAVSAETGIPAAELHPDLLLEEDLELWSLSLWAVVAEVERNLGLQLPDNEVAAWVSLADMLRAAKSTP